MLRHRFLPVGTVNFLTYIHHSWHTKHYKIIIFFASAATQKTTFHKLTGERHLRINMSYNNIRGYKKKLQIFQNRLVDTWNLILSI